MFNYTASSPEVFPIWWEFYYIVKLWFLAVPDRVFTDCCWFCSIPGEVAHVKAIIALGARQFSGLCLFKVIWKFQRLPPSLNAIWLPKRIRRCRCRSCWYWFKKAVLKNPSATLYVDDAPFSTKTLGKCRTSARFFFAAQEIARVLFMLCSLTPNVILCIVSKWVFLVIV